MHVYFSALILLFLVSLTNSVRICHHNDFQARYVETDANNQFCPASTPSNQCFSSAARLSTAFDLFKCDIRVSAGDFSFGTLYWNIFDEEIAIAAYNAIGYDLAIFGIEDVTLGFGPIIKTIRNTPRISWLGTNINLIGSSAVANVSRVQERNGICFVSALTPSFTRLYDYSSDITVSDPVLSIQQSLASCQNRRNVVAITHLGIENDVRLCNSVRELDLIIGGFSQNNLAKSGQYPRKVRRADGSICYIVTAYAFGRQMGFTDVTFTNGKLNFDGYGIVPLDRKIEQDKNVAKIMDSFTRRIDTRSLNEPVAILNAPIPDNCFGRECSRGNLICDALLDATERNADVCIVNSDYSRGSFPKGTITEGDLLILSQFPNNLSIITTTGRGLINALESGFSANINDPIAYGPFPQIAGMRVIYNLTKPVGNRVVNVAIKNNPIIPSFTYKIVTSSFLALGNYGYRWEGASQTQISSVTIRETVEFYLRFNNPYTPYIDGRLRNIG